MIVSDSGAECCLVDIAFLADYRCGGRGSKLISDLLTRVFRAQKAVRLHVTTTNPAIRLYQRLGFRIVADDGVYLEMIAKPATEATNSGDRAVP